MEEVIASQRNDPVFVQQEKIREEKVKTEKEKYLIEEEPIRKDLKEIGVHVEDLWVYVNGDLPSEAAAQVIKKHLALEYDDKVTDALIRSLMDKKFSGYLTQELLSTLEKKPYKNGGYRPYLRHTIADALRITGTDLNRSVIDDLIHDKNNQDILGTLRKIAKKIR